MKVKQKTIRIFELECLAGDDVAAFADQNFAILKDFLLVVSGDGAAEGLAILRSRGLEAIAGASLPPLSTKKEGTEVMLAAAATAPAVTTVVTAEPSPAGQEERSEKLFFDRPVRSGEEIDASGDLVIYGRINGGARVTARGNLGVFGTIDGTVVCDGDFILLRGIGQGHVVFRGEILDRDLLAESKKGASVMKKVTFENGRLVVKELG